MRYFFTGALFPRAVVFWLALLALPLTSTALMIGLTTEELTKASGLVVLGRVQTVVSAWSADKRTIFTTAKVTVEGVIKGTYPKAVLAVEYDGGEVGETGLRVSDGARLLVGERVLLFLLSATSKGSDQEAAPGEGVYNLVGKAQGKYSVDDEGRARKGGYSVAGAETRIDNNIPVEELIAKIKALR